MPELRIRGLTDDQFAQVKERAAVHGMTPAQFARWLLLDPAPPMTQTELAQLVAAKAREGNIRAMEILARRVPVGGTPPPVDEPAPAPAGSTFDELAARRVAQ